MENLKITKNYLLDIVKNPLTTKEIHYKIINDFNINPNYFKINDTKNLFKISNISLRNKPRKKL